jgi:hypothetical protein
MKFNSKIIKDAVRRKDAKFFYNLYCELDLAHRKTEEVSCVYDLNFGDRNSRTLTLQFHKLDCYVTLEGTHSSYSDPYWTKVYFSQPYEHTEIRYREHYDTLQ